MSEKIVLCADSTSVRYPEVLGLSGENLEKQNWLKVHSSAVETRAQLLSSASSTAAWVASSDDVDAINTAAALKADCPERTVCLLAPDATGSFKSRAAQAGVDFVWSTSEFVAHYAACKKSDWPVGDQSADHRPAEKSLPVEASASRKPVAKLPADGKAATATPPEASLSRDAPEAASAKGFLLPVVSGSGGAGKSTIAALCGAVAKRQGRNVAVLDLDLQFGDMRYMLGLPDAPSIDDLLTNPARVDRLSSEEGLPVLVTAPQKLESFETVMPKMMQLVDLLRQRFDVVIVNTGAFWTDLHAQLLDSASRALFLVDQRPASLWACKHALDLCERCGIAQSPFEFVANRVSKGALYTSIDVSCALHGGSAVELADGGPDVEELLSSGHPKELMDSRNSLCLDIDELLMRLLPEMPGVDQAFSSTGIGRFAFWRNRRGRRSIGEEA